MAPLIRKKLNGKTLPSGFNRHHYVISPYGGKSTLFLGGEGVLMRN
jgi:hypothetical protein